MALDIKLDSSTSVGDDHNLWLTRTTITKKQTKKKTCLEVGTYFKLLLFDSIFMVDYFIVILHIWDPVAALLQLTGRHSLDEVRFVGGFHQGWVKLCGDTGESLCEGLRTEKCRVNEGRKSRCKQT